MIWLWSILAVVLLLVAIAIYDLMQRQHSILRNFPIIGHFRYIFESVGPELRQYIVTDNDEERPFSRDQRRWVYASSKSENNYFGFGTDNEIEQASNYLIINHAALPLPEPKHDPGHPERLACAKVLGQWRNRAKAFRPNSIVNVSAMSFGSLSAAAIEAINKGCASAGCLHNTGEGGISQYHRKGGELIWQIGTGYFGCRNPDGSFSTERFRESVESAPVRAIEIKLSQGAKPGLGGVLPAVKITPEIAEIRGIPMDRDCISPPVHTTFHDVDSMLDFIEQLADQTGLPVGIKSAVGQIGFWQTLAARMQQTSRGPDFITIDGGEGGTGAAPLAFSDHVSHPFKIGFSRVFRIFAQHDLHNKIVFIGSGRLGLPESALFGFALGCDMIGVAREAMLSIGCIQAQRCHTGHCPTGVATQNKWLMRGLDPTLKSVRFARYILTLHHEIARLCRACGVPHPALITGEHLEVLDGRFGSTCVRELFNYDSAWSEMTDSDRAAITKLTVHGS